MAVAAAHRTIEEQMAAVLRAEVLDEISRQGLDAHTIADQLDLLPTAVATVLTRDHWSLKTALAMADGLKLPVTLTAMRTSEG